MGPLLCLHPLSGPVTLRGGGGGGGGGGGWGLPPLRDSSYFCLKSYVAGCCASPEIPDEVRRDRFGAVGSEDSLLSHADLPLGLFPHPSRF